jgi:Zn-dependent metalloprotease
MGGELVVQLDREREPAAARQVAIAAVRKEHGVLPRTLRAAEPELWIYDSRLLGGPGIDRPVLVWRTTVTTVGVGPIDEIVLVDAQLGAVVLQFNQVEFVRNRSTYTANNGSSLPGQLKCGEGSPLPACASGDADVEGAHRSAGDTYDFYASRNGRDSYDNAGAPIVSTVHWRDPNDPGSPFDNAFWSPEDQQMVFGDARTFTAGDDVIAHELTHAVTERESGLFYYYQAGAINESLSDVFGEFVDLTNGRGDDSAGVRWLMGEDVSPGGAARNLKDPTAFGDPDRMTSPFYWQSESDEGGVHANSGVNSKAAYLMTDGDTFNGTTVSGIGLDKTARTWSGRTGSRSRTARRSRTPSTRSR